MTRLYRVAEFARLAGVTVRTLQYYDREGLLHPADVTEAGYRLYRLEDLLRLQQILTLKWMGFTLSEIKRILTSPGYDLRQALIEQKAAVDAQVARLQEASAALAAMVEKVGAEEAEPVDAETLGVILRGVTREPKEAWTHRYYSDVAWASIQLRRLAYSPEEMQQAQQDWQAVYAAFEQHRGEAPDSPAVQQLAGQMDRLIEGFTGGNPAVETGLRRLVADAGAGALPTDYAGPTPFGDVDDELRQLMQAALAIYQARKRT